MSQLEQGFLRRRRATLDPAWWLAAAHLPLASLQTARMLRSEQFQYAPLIWLCVAGLIWRRVVPQPPGPWARLVGRLLLAVAAVGLVAATLFVSPWLGWISLVLSLGGILLRAYGPGVLRYWMILWFAAPWPQPLADGLVLQLQSGATHIAGRVMDVLHVEHVFAGHVIESQGRRFLVEEACSGVQSLFSLTALAVVLGAWLTRPWIRYALLIASAAFWAVGVNVVRIVLIVGGWTWWGVDLSQGWPHFYLGVGCFVGGLLLLLSTDRAWHWLLEPTGLTLDALADESFLGPSRRTRAVASFNPITNAFNRLAMWGAALCPERKLAYAGGAFGPISVGRVNDAGSRGATAPAEAARAEPNANGGKTAGTAEKLPAPSTAAESKNSGLHQVAAKTKKGKGKRKSARRNRGQKKTAESRTAPTQPAKSQAAPTIVAAVEPEVVLHVPPTGARAKQPPRRGIAGRLARGFWWLIRVLVPASAALLLCALQSWLLWWTPGAVRPLEVPQISSASITAPDGWVCLENEQQQRQRDSLLGAQAQIWRFRLPNGAATLELDYPFVGWHGLEVCYQAQGWRVNRMELMSGLSESPWMHVELERSSGRKALLLYDVIGFDGVSLAPDGWLQYRHALAVRGRFGWLLRRLRNDRPSFQVQMFVQLDHELTPQDTAALHAAFQSSRAQLRTQVAIDHP